MTGSNTHQNRHCSLSLGIVSLGTSNLPNSDENQFFVKVYYVHIFQNNYYD